MNRLPMIMDVDTGCDDAIEIILAHLQNHLDIKGITCVAGNTDVDHVVQNTVNILAFLNQKTPVYRGEMKPCDRPLKMDYFHGINGLGTVELENAKWQEPSVDAIEFMHECLKEDCTLLCSAPLTNVHTLLHKYPEDNKHIKEIVWMGGSLSGGNVSLTSEFNAHVDPTALHTILHSGIPFTMIGLDVTMKLNLPDAVWSSIQKMDTKASKLIQKILKYLIGKEEEGTHLHDVVALCALIHPEYFTFKEYYVDVECAEVLTRGMTVADVRNVTKNKPNCKVALDVDMEKFWTWFMESLGGKV